MPNIRTENNRGRWTKEALEMANICKEKLKPIFAIGKERGYTPEQIFYLVIYELQEIDIDDRLFGDRGVI